MAPAALAKQSEAADTLSANVSYSSPSSSSATLSSSSATSAGSHPSASSSSSSAAPSAAAAVSLIPTFVSKNPLAIIAHTRQRANPALRFVKQVPLEFADHIIPDFELGEATWALFLSLKYHLLHQTYLAGRCASIARGAASSSSSATSQPQMAATRLRLILILVDVDDCEKILEDLTVFANAQAWTIILAWSNQEVGRYLETFKAYEKKSADVLKERLDSDAERFHDCFAQVRSINKSDINTLAQSFGSFAGVCGASAESLALLPGLGPKKVSPFYFLSLGRCFGWIRYHQIFSHHPDLHSFVFGLSMGATPFFSHTAQVQRLLETLRAPFRPDSAKTTLPSNVLMGTLDTSVLRRVATAPASVSASAAATTAQGGSLTNADASTEVLSSSSSSSEAAAFEHEPDSMRSIDSPKPDDSMASESI